MKRRSTIPRTRGWGVGVAVLTAMVSGVSIFVNGYGVRAKAFGNPSAYTTAKNLVAAVILIAILAAATASRSSGGWTRPRGTQWIGLGLIGVFGGGVAFILFFEGLARASSVHAAFIQKSLVVWVAIGAVIVLRERLSVAHLAAIALLVGGLIGVEGGLRGFRFGSGELMIAAATLLWSAEVIVAKRLLASVSSATLGVARMTIGIAVLITWTVMSGKASGLLHAGAVDWKWALATGALLAVYVTTWFAALARAQAVDVTAVLVLGAVITALLQAGVQNVALRPHGAGLISIAAGASIVFFAGLRRRAAETT